MEDNKNKSPVGGSLTPTHRRLQISPYFRADYLNGLDKMVRRLSLFLLGLPVSWVVAEAILLIPSAWFSNAFETVFTIEQTRIHFNLVFNLSEMLLAFSVVTLVIFIAKLLPVKFKTNKHLLLWGCFVSYLFLFSFAMLASPYSLEGTLFFGTKIVFNLLGVLVAWFTFTGAASKT